MYVRGYSRLKVVQFESCVWFPIRIP